MATKQNQLTASKQAETLRKQNMRTDMKSEKNDTYINDKQMTKNAKQKNAKQTPKKWQKNDKADPKWQTQMQKKWQNNYFGISNVCRPKIFLRLAGVFKHPLDFVTKLVSCVVLKYSCHFLALIWKIGFIGRVGITNGSKFNFLFLTHLLSFRRGCTGICWGLEHGRAPDAISTHPSNHLCVCMALTGLGEWLSQDMRTPVAKTLQRQVPSPCVLRTSIFPTSWQLNMKLRQTCSLCSLSTGLISSSYVRTYEKDGAHHESISGCALFELCQWEYGQNWTAHLVLCLSHRLQITGRESNSKPSNCPTGHLIHPIEISLMSSNGRMISNFKAEINKSVAFGTSHYMSMNISFFQDKPRWRVPNDVSFDRGHFSQ